MDSEQPEVLVCARCGAQNPPDRDACWICHEPLDPKAAPASRSTLVDQASGPRFALSSVLMVIALVAVGFGLIREAPWLGVPVVILVTPALLRTSVAARRRPKDRPMTLAEMLLSLIASLGLIVMVGTAALVAFAIVCSAAFFGGLGLGQAASGNSQGEEGLFAGLIAGVVLGTIAALIVAWRISRRAWKKESR
jgi:ribosomal protein L40E